MGLVSGLVDGAGFRLSRYVWSQACQMGLVSGLVDGAGLRLARWDLSQA